MPESRGPTVFKLGVAVTIAYASTYYLLAIIGQPMAAEIGVSTSTVFLALSASLLVSAVLGPFSGRLVDRHGGRVVLSSANLVFAAGLMALAWAQGPVSLFGAWLLLGLAMSAGFYEAVFSSLVRLYGTGARPSITGVTLIAGFASTVGWPLSGWLLGEVGWRGTCMAWAALHLLIALPLNLWVPQAEVQADGASAPAAASQLPQHPLSLTPAQSRRIGWLLAFVFGVTWFVSTAMATHLPRLLQAHGVSLAAAIGLAALVGPAQVAGRLLEYGLLRNVSPLLSARLASLAHAVGAVLFMALGVPAGVVFTVLHGAGNGIMTIANGTLPLIFFGPAGYGARQGALMMPARFAQAMAPFLFGLAIDGMGASALWLSIGMGVSAFTALMLLRPVKNAETQ